MKTKIIYISGNEVFEMAQIRAAFEEVRNALGLDKDTILFGVPVDSDNALANTAPEYTDTIQDTPMAIETVETCEAPEEAIEPTPVSSITTEEITEEVTIIEEPTQNTGEEEQETEAEPVIPILSILSTNDDEAQPAADEEEPVIAAVAEEEIAIVSEPVPEEQPEETANTDTLAVSIDDIIADEAPVAEHEKTLEELLESMTPLGEDIIPEPEPAPESEPENIIDADTEFSISMSDDASDTDATLAQLANEFAQTQDKIPNTPKATSNGKIGKLKNILPFKKAKRDDNSLMGDLFGWAGIAANDEDFSIPGFFTGTSGQK